MKRYKIVKHDKFIYEIEKLQRIILLKQELEVKKETLFKPDKGLNKYIAFIDKNKNVDFGILFYNENELMFSVSSLDTEFLNYIDIKSQSKSSSSKINYILFYFKRLLKEETIKSLV